MALCHSPLPMHSNSGILIVARVVVLCIACDCLCPAALLPSAMAVMPLYSHAFLTE